MVNKRFVRAILIPSMILLFIFSVLPIVGSFVISLFDYNPLRAENHFLGIENYIRLTKDPVFIKALQNTIKFVLITVILNITISLFFAQLLSTVRIRFMRDLFFVMIFLSCVAPLANSSVVWMKAILPTRHGMFNQILGLFGVAPINWIGNSNLVLFSIIIFSLWADVGYNTILFNAGIDAIPKTFYEAADIDGAGPFSQFFYITLPLLGRTFSFVIAMTLISHFQMFVQFNIFAGDGGQNNAARVLSTYIYHVGFKVKDMGYASSISVVLFGLILIITLFQQRLNKVDWGY